MYFFFGYMYILQPCKGGLPYRAMYLSIYAMYMLQPCKGGFFPSHHQVFNASLDVYVAATLQGRVAETTTHISRLLYVYVVATLQGRVARPVPYRFMVVDTRQLCCETSHKHNRC